ncbi:NAD(P)H azoreductase [Nymphon striatum]|nr:NAD(P)H azoreductase [Nymphon striatum]
MSASRGQMGELTADTIDTLRAETLGIYQDWIARAKENARKWYHWAENVINAAKDAGVRYIVKQSGLNAGSDATSDVIHDHATTDAMIKASGLDYTLLQPNSFYQNFYGSLPTIQADGNFYAPLGNAALSQVDIHDVAAVAAQVLTSDGHVGKTYQLTGPEALTSAEQAALLSTASGKDISFIDVPQADYAAALVSAGLDERLSDTLAAMMAWFAIGDYAPVYDNVQNILGRPARSFESFAQEFAQVINAQSS